MRKDPSATINALMGVFRQKGYDGSSLQDLGEAVGLRKSSLYHSFPGGKAEMGEAALGHAMEWFESRIVAPLTGHGDPVIRLAAAITAMREFYGDGQTPCLLDAMDIGEGRRCFNAQIREAMGRLLEAFTRVAEDAGLESQEARQRAERVLIMTQGSLVVARGMDDAGVFFRAMERMPRLLLG